MQAKMIEVRSSNDKWLLLNTRDIKCVVFDREPSNRDLFKISILYYADEGELVLHGVYTEKECAVLAARITDTL